MCAQASVCAVRVCSLPKAVAVLPVVTEGPVFPHLRQQMKADNLCEAKRKTFCEVRSQPQMVGRHGAALVALALPVAVTSLAVTTATRPEVLRPASVAATPIGKGPDPSEAVLDVDDTVLVASGDDASWRSAMAQLWHDETLIDCTVEASGEEFKAHRLALAASSGFLKDVLSTEGTKSRVTLQDMPSEAFGAILSWIYDGSTSVREALLPDLHVGCANPRRCTCVHAEAVGCFNSVFVHDCKFEVGRTWQARRRRAAADVSSHC